MKTCVLYSSPVRTHHHQQSIFIRDGNRIVGQVFVRAETRNCDDVAEELERQTPMHGEVVVNSVEYGAEAAAR